MQLGSFICVVYGDFRATKAELSSFWQRPFGSQSLKYYDVLLYRKDLFTLSSRWRLPIMTTFMYFPLHLRLLYNSVFWVTLGCCYQAICHWKHVFNVSLILCLRIYTIARVAAISEVYIHFTWFFILASERIFISVTSLLCLFLLIMLTLFKLAA